MTQLIKGAVLRVDWRRNFLGAEKPLGDHCGIPESGSGGLRLGAGFRSREERKDLEEKQ